MAIQTAGAIPYTPILREKKVTLYRLHPRQSEPDFFGLVMVMPNMPFGLRERDRWLNVKGYKFKPEELVPGAEVQKTPSGEIYLVPLGYELKSFPEKALSGDGKTKIDVTVWRVVKNEGGGQFPCPQCDKLCVSEFGLKSHMRSHKTK